MINRTRWTTHAVVGGAVVLTAALGAFGVIGAGDQGLFRGEHFDAKQVTVVPDGADGVRISEVVDIDFGLQERRGYQRIIPNDFGRPTDVAASSPDANADIGIVDLGRDTRIRLGDPFVTFTGQRRYLLDYTLPDAQISTGRLALDIIGADETFTTDRFEVWLVGFVLDGPTCDTGPRGAFGGCELELVDEGRYRVIFEPLDPGDGITVSGDVVGFVEAEGPSIPPAPERNRREFRPIALVQLLAGGLVALAVFGWFRRQGSNEVFGSGGAADAASVPTNGELPVPMLGDPAADVPTYRVPDSRLADLATIEFVPPRGVAPWQGTALLSEKIGTPSISAWFSEMIARGAIVLDDSSGAPVMFPGQSDARLSAVDRGHLVELFSTAPVITLGTYDAKFAKVWKRIGDEQKRFIRDAGWWQRPIVSVVGDAGTGAVGVAVTLLVAVGLLAGLAAAIYFSFAVFGLHNTLGGAVAITVVVALVFATLGYASMLASRTATGSALTLRTESFRRFLEASEGRHVEWAWEHGLVREYSAWAVALGAADAWSEAVEESPVDAPVSVTAPLLIHSYSSSLSSAHTAPSSSSSGGGGGGSGGGGGGGSSGSW